MIGFIKGIVDVIDSDKLIIDCGHIGYNVFVPTSILDATFIGEELKLYTHHSVREDGMSLFGFLDRRDLDMYRKLISVSGIGPKVGMSIMSSISVEDLKYAIIAGDSKTIAKCPGIGPKTAMKLIVEIKDSIDMTDMLDTTEIRTGKVSDATSKNSSSSKVLINDAVMALVSLGYSNTESMRAVRAVGECDSVEEIIKLALKKLM